jgi:hypothetical protein
MEGTGYKGHSDCWYIQPYSRILISTAKGETFDVPAAMINTKPEGWVVFCKHKLQNKHQWRSSHDEESTAKDGKKTLSYEIRL